jgi:hypothetical protein
VERYEVEYRYYFVEITVRECFGSRGENAFATDIRVTAEPSRMRGLEWIRVNNDAHRSYASEAAALEDGLGRGMAYVDGMLSERVKVEGAE